MIVYGDPKFEESGEVLLERLRARASGCVAAPVLDELRTLVIQAGEVEQAAEDAAGALIDELTLSGIRVAADRTADAFVAHLREPESEQRARSLLERALLELRHCSLSPAPLTVKVPEGFAFYMLYPEQYVAAVANWLRGQREPTRRVAVVGIRSIGTALSAVVGAALRAAGLEVTRFTVRPAGHPFERRCELRREQLGGAEAALIVDEGPGLSGSSMAAVASALMKAGLPRERIALLPGHNRDPGTASSEGVRTLWRTLPRFTAPVEEMRWGGASLEQLLTDASLSGSMLASHNGDSPVVRDMGGGLWRERAYTSPEEWPAVCAPFERSKYLCASPRSERLLWKFAGFAVGPGGETLAQVAARRIGRLAALGWTPPVVGSTLGFIAQPWVEGRPLAPSDRNRALMSQVGRYIADAAGLPLSPDECHAAHSSLCEMVYWNVREIGGEELGTWARRMGDEVRETAVLQWPTYGDGRLAPHEWRERGGRLVKLDCGGHELDHTIVGRQPVTWDVAGTLVEWQAAESIPQGPALREALIRAVEKALGLALPAELTRFHELAYAAFRMGQCAMCAEMGDASERERLLRAAECYRRKVIDVLRRSHRTAVRKGTRQG